MVKRYCIGCSVSAGDIGSLPCRESPGPFHAAVNMVARLRERHQERWHFSSGAQCADGNQRTAGALFTAITGLLTV